MIKEECHIDVQEKKVRVTSTASKGLRHNPAVGFLATDSRPPISCQMVRTGL